MARFLTGWFSIRQKSYHWCDNCIPPPKQFSKTHTCSISLSCQLDTLNKISRKVWSRLRRFLLELGRDFTFVGEQYLLQVGGKDFRLDLLFYHRELQCLVAFELKIEEFEPEHLGKLEFYLEALDRNVKKLHERPSIGVLLCATKDGEVVEYALSRSASPALIAEYQTALPGRKLLQRKLHEFYQLALPQGETKKRLKARPRGKT